MIARPSKIARPQNNRRLTKKSPNVRLALEIISVILCCLLNCCFFEMIANEYEEFLVTFQTDKPMSMFLHRDLEKLLGNQMKRFVKKEVLDGNSSASQDK